MGSQKFPTVKCFFSPVATLVTSRLEQKPPRSHNHEMSKGDYGQRSDASTIYNIKVWYREMASTKPINSHEDRENFHEPKQKLPMRKQKFPWWV